MVRRISDFTGRTVDVMITDTFEGELSFVIPNMIITGIQKVVQNFIVLFFTAVGSKILNPEDGSVFANQIVESRVFTQEDYLHVVVIAISEVLDTMIEDQNLLGIEREDERIASAILLDSDLINGELSMTIKIEVESGNNFEFVLPVKLPIVSF